MRHRRSLTVGFLIILATFASAEILYDFEQAFFVEDFDVKCKDHALVFDSGLYHLYFIQSYPDGPVEPLDSEQWLGHATSPDLRHWTRQDSILHVQPGTWESGFIWAPHVIENPAGGWLMYYTGADTSSVVRQRTGMAWSDDLYNWQRYEFNPIHEPGDWTDWADPLYAYANCRDPFVFQAPDDPLYYMLNSVRSESGGGAIDIAVSEDLFNWSESDTFMIHSSANMLESVSLWQDEADKWHVFFTEQNYPGTYHTFAMDPMGPFWPGAAHLYDAGYGAEVTVIDEQTHFSRYARAALLAGDRYFIRFDQLETPPWSGDWPVLASSQGLQEWWTPQFGTAFNNQPTWGDNPVERSEPSSNMEGNSYISTLELFPYPGFSNPGRSRGVGPQGVLKSDVFAIDGDRLGMLVGGGDHESTCFVALVRESDGRLLFRETGANTNGMDSRLWNTETLIGESAFLIIADLSSEAWGWISTDAIHEYMREGEDPLPPSDPIEEDIYLGDLLSSADVDWNCDFSASVTFGSVPLYVIFTNQTDGEAEIYEWDFENDGIADKFTRDVAHSYSEPGLYTVKLRVVNDLGMEAVKVKENYILVLENETNVLIFASEITSGLPTPVSFGYSGEDSLSYFSTAVEFDSTRIEYQGLQNWLPEASFKDSLDGQTIFINWFDETGLNPIAPREDPLFMFGLVFKAIAATDTTQITFLDEFCLLKDAAGDTIQNLGWVDEPPFGRVILDVTCLVTGSTDYYTQSSPLPGVVLSMGPPQEDIVSNAWGEFEFEPYAMGDYILRISKSDDLVGSNSLDAVKILRHASGVEILDGEYRLQAADVNLDEAIDSLDAVCIVETAVGLATMAAGDWGFDPDSVIFEPLNTDTHIPITGLRMGDVNGDWVSGWRGAPLETRNDGRDLISLSLPDTTLAEGGDPFVQIALLATGLESLAAMSLRIAYADSILEFTGLDTNQAGFDPMVSADDGLIRIEWFDATVGDSLFSQQNDTLLVLNFTTGRIEWSVSPLDFLALSVLGDSIGDAIEGVEFIDGSVTIPGQGVGADTPPLPAFSLQQNFPNPFNPSTQIRFSLALDSVVSLRIYDLEGRLIRYLVPGTQLDAGRHSVEWDGRDRRGREVSSGVYFYSLDTDEFSDTRKMVLVR